MSGYKRIGGRQLRYRRLWWLLAHHEDPDFDPDTDDRLFAVCLNYRCCNPDHAALKPNSSTRPRGEAHGQAKLTVDEVREIKRRLARGEAYIQIAKSFPHITFGAVAGIATGRSWRHIEAEAPVEA